jgi:hypothetical protein
VVVESLVNSKFDFALHCDERVGALTDEESSRPHCSVRPRFHILKCEQIRERPKHVTTHAL